VTRWNYLPKDVAERSRVHAIQKIALPKQKMNKWETEYAQILELRKRTGEIEWWKFEGMTLRLADGARFTPDFAVKFTVAGLQFHEVKGFMREAAFVRLKVAREMFPFPFKLIKKIDGRLQEVKF
jgi:hypothetical protein